MTVVLTGHDLAPADVVRVARGRVAVALHPTALERMARTRAVVESVARSGSAAYGVTTAVGVLKRVEVDDAEAGAYARRMIRHHLVGQGEPAPTDVVRAAIVRLANAFAAGWPGVRPLVAERLVDALNRGEVPPVRVLGSIGQADLAPMADLAAALFGDVELAAGEGLALVSSNAFTTGWATLVAADARALVETLDAAGALSLEGLAGNPSGLVPAVADARPYPGLRASIERLRELLDGSAIWEPGRPRSLQDPLTFRNLPQLHGAARDVLASLEAVLSIELNASDSNPIVVLDEERVASVANFEILPLAVALDTLRAVLASVLSASAERSVKLLETPWSGLPTGLVAEAGTSDAGLAYLGIAVQSLAAEARLLAAPVSFEVVSTTHAEGIEDRATMAPLAARRTADLVELGRRIAAVELAVAAQASELRGGRRGRGTEAAHAAVRACVPFLVPGETVPDLQPLVEAVARGAFTAGSQPWR